MVVCWLQIEDCRNKSQAICAINLCFYWNSNRRIYLYRSYFGDTSQVAVWDRIDFLNYRKALNFFVALTSRMAGDMNFCTLRRRHRSAC